MKLGKNNVDENTEYILKNRLNGAEKSTLLNETATLKDISLIPADYIMNAYSMED